MVRLPFWGSVNWVDTWKKSSETWFFPQKSNELNGPYVFRRRDPPFPKPIILGYPPAVRKTQGDELFSKLPPTGSKFKPFPYHPSMLHIYLHLVDFLWFSYRVNIPFVPWIRHGFFVEVFTTPPLKTNGWIPKMMGWRLLGWCFFLVFAEKNLEIQPGGLEGVHV